MKQDEPTSQVEELRLEYLREDLGKGVRGKYFEAYTNGLKADLPKPPERSKPNFTPG